MKNFVAGITALIAASSIANAADLPAKAPAPVALPYGWSGFYVGGNLGYEWTDPKSFPLTGTQNVPAPGGVGPLSFQADGLYPLTSSLGQTGAIGGLQAGYNWQFNSWVTGVEADFDLSSAGKSWSTSACCGTGAAAATTNMSRRLDSLATLRARFGFAAGRTLYYVTGGLAVGESTLAYTAALTNVFGSLGSPYSAATAWQTGWTIGGGIEYAPWDQGSWDHWSIKAEYLYYDLGTQSVTIAANVVPVPGESWTAAATVRNNGQIVRGGVNYRF